MLSTKPEVHNIYCIVVRKQPNHCCRQRAQKMR